jgi:ATP-dependent Zn protease
MTPEHRRVLAHESGHALVAWFSPACHHVVEIIARENGNGIVDSMWSGPESAPVLWEMTAQCLGGLAGEYCGIGKYRASGAQDDLLKAVGRARIIVQGGVRDGMPWSVDALAEHVPHLERAFANGLTVTEANVMNTAMRHAIHQIEEHRDGFVRLQKRLATQRLVYGRELEEYFGDRSMIRLLGQFR